MASGIYRIDLGNGSFYIGSAINLVKRKNKHRNELKHKIHRNTRMQNCWNKYQIFKFVILEECAKNDLIVREQFHIDQNRDDPKMTNICLVAGSCLGIIRSAKTRAKQSAAAKGRVISAEQRVKISASLTGYKHSAETRAKLSASRKNMSVEHRAKIGAAIKGKKRSAETRTKMSKAAKAYYARKREAA